MALPKFLEQTSEKIKTPNIEYLLKKIDSYYLSADLSLVQKAYKMAEEAHRGQVRKDGSPYITHPLNVAVILAELNLDLYTIIAGLLHDVVEDTSISLQQIEKEFNSTVAFLVDGVSKISQIPFKNSHQKTSENMRKMIVAVAQDVRVLLVKLADRLHNMRTLRCMPPDRRVSISQETLDIYAPLASRLGIYSLKVEMEDLAFQYSDTEGFNSLVQKMVSEKQETERYIEDVISVLKEEIIQKAKLNAEITGRLKNVYSIYQKMINQNVDYNQVYDILAFRICTEKIEDCYKVLGIIHSIWKPIPGRFKDYIAIPKTNNYQSLHSTVLAEKGKRVEIQIRTSEMHLLAERGIAAHWKYKTESWDVNPRVDKETLRKFNWLQDLVSLHRNHNNSGEFLESVKMDLFDLDIYIFTPQGDVKEFPKGATPIDFAYGIHTDLGHRITGARVNGRLVPLKTKLKNGDTVEIITSKNQVPSEEWVKYCVTSKAKSKIKYFVRMERRKASLQIGQNILEKEFRQRGLKIEAALKSPVWNKYIKDNGINSREELYSRVAYGKVLVKDLVALFIPDKKEQLQLLPAKVSQEENSNNLCPVVVDGLGNIMVHFAKCCSPIPGDSITGFISRGKGIMVHRHSCQTLLSLDSERYVDVQWNRNQKARHIVLIKVLAHDVPGVLTDLSAVFANQNVNILQLKVTGNKDFKSTCLFSVELRDLEQLQSLLQSLKSLKSVISVARENKGL